MSKRTMVGMVVALTLALAASPVLADQTWEGLTDTDFENVLNWVGNVAAPANDLVTDVAIFNDPTVVGLNQPSLTIARDVLGLNFTQAGWTLGGSGLSLGVGASGISSAGAGTNTVAPDINLGGSQSWTVGAGNTLSVTGLVGETVVGSNLTKLGAGTLALSDAASYTGTTEVREGTLLLQGNATLTSNVGIYGPARVLLNNAGTAVDDRLGGALGNYQVRMWGMGAELAVTGNAGADTFENFGELRTESGLNFITLSPNAATNLSVTAASLNRRNGSMTVVRGTNLGGAFGDPNVSNLFFTAAPTLNGGTLGTTAAGIVRGLVASDSDTGQAKGLATYDIDGVRLLDLGTEYSNSLAATDTNVRLTADVFNVPGNNRTVNTLTLGAGNTVVDLTGSNLQVRYGWFVEDGVDTTVKANRITGIEDYLNYENLVYTAGSAKLTLEGTWLRGDYGHTLTKAGSGELVLNGQVLLGPEGYSGPALVVSEGKVTMGNAGVLRMGSTLRVDGTLDLAGTNQDLGELVGGSGVITNSAALSTLHLLQNETARTFDGQITGALNVHRGGHQNLVLTRDNTFTGETELNGGSTRLLGAGALSGTSGVAINAASLRLDDRQGVLANRLSDSAAVTLNGATLQFYGIDGGASAETIGAVTVGQGLSTIALNPGSGGTLAVTAASLAQADKGVLQVSGLAAGSELFLTAAPTLANGIISGSVVVGGADFATYESTTPLGLIALGTVFGARPTGIDGGTGVENVLASANQTLTAGSTIHSAVLDGGVGDVNLGGFTLNLGSGGLIKSSGSATIQNGNLTAGGTADLLPDNLFIHVNSSTTTLSAKVTDNGGDAVSLIKGGSGTLTLGNSANDHTGGTYVHGGTLTFSPVSSQFVPGGLNVVAATVQLTQSGQLSPSSVVTLENNATLNMGGFNQTVGGLALTRSGGVGDVLVTTGAGLLTLAGNVSAFNVDAQSSFGIFARPRISGAMDMGGAARTFDVTAATPDLVALDISAAIQGSGDLIKTGNGILLLSSGNTFAGAVRAEEGLIQFSANDRLGSPANSVVLGGAATEGGLRPTTTGMTLSRNLTLGAGGGLISVPTASGWNLTLTGNVTGSGGLSIVGDLGKNVPSVTLSFASSNYSGPLQVENASVRINNPANAGNSGMSLFNARVINASGTAMTLTGSSQFGGSVTLGDATVGTSRAITLAGPGTLTSDTVIEVAAE